MKKECNEPVITIHDCFATHPNNTTLLRDIVKNEFAEMY